MSVAVGSTTLEAIRTSGGVVAATVTRPAGPPRAAALIFAGQDRTRSGPNRLWARLAENLAAAGLAVLRTDYAGAGESDPLRPGVDKTAVAAEVVGWFRSRAGDVPLVLVGFCYGARVVLRLFRRGVRSDRMVLINPALRWYLAHPPTERALLRLLGPAVHIVVRAAGRGRGGRPVRRPWDREMIAALDEASRSISVRVLVGDLHASHSDILAVEPEIAAAGGRLEIEMVPRSFVGAADAWGSPGAQDELLARAGIAVTAGLPTA